MYKLIKDKTGQPWDFILRLEDGLYIPKNTNNYDYLKYLKWLDGYEYDVGNMEWVKTSEGNTPEPADE